MDFYYVPVYASLGVICLISAAVYWQLSLARPAAIDVALPRDRKLYTNPSWPQMALYYFQRKRHELGIQTVKEGSNFLRSTMLKKQ